MIKLQFPPLLNVEYTLPHRVALGIKLDIICKALSTESITEKAINKYWFLYLIFMSTHQRGLTGLQMKWGLHRRSLVKTWLCTPCGLCLFFCQMEGVEVLFTADWTGQWCLKAVFPVLPGGLLQLMCLLISADRKTEILPHRFAYLHWKCKLGKGHRIIYTYGPHTAFSFNSWCFPVPHRSSHYAMVFAGILVVSQKSPASFLNLYLAISWSFSDRDELGFSFLNIKFEECIWTPEPSFLYWLDIRLNDASSIAEGSVRAVLECSG